MNYINTQKRIKKYTILPSKLKTKSKVKSIYLIKLSGICKFQAEN